jgi:hypothetical protein
MEYPDQEKHPDVIAAVARHDLALSRYQRAVRETAEALFDPDMTNRKAIDAAPVVDKARTEYRCADEHLWHLRENIGGSDWTA